MSNLLSVVIVAVMIFDSVQPANGQECWTEWFDRDDPSGSGDWEKLSDLLNENPGKICDNPSDIEFETLSGLTPAQAGDIVYKGDVMSGFICRNADQPDGECSDYRVRFKCQSPNCLCWTKWYDRDDPSGTGDWETFKDLREGNPEICQYPLNIDAVTTDTLSPALSTDEIFYVYCPTKGFVCRNKDQKSGTCRDYKVRFQCPCA